MSLTDLELIKAVAEIDGIEVLSGWQGADHCFIEREGAIIEVSHDHSDGRKMVEVEYNPLTDKALLFDLEYKYYVSTCRYHDFVYIESEYADRPHKASISFSSKEEKPRAILECIVESKSK